ncbi:MAG: DUF1684 domain-containing protein [Anaerolineales bacterium]|nr:DUF1684 domain-containing protein [Anaerolineales bacterium]
MSSIEYTDRINQLRAEKFQAAKSNPLDWLNLAGLFWLEEGENSFGSAESNKIVLPQFPAAECGSFKLENGIVTFTPAQGVEFSANAADVDKRALHTDRTSDPDLINFGSLTIKVIVRGAATLLRIWDREAPVKQAFTGFKYYPPNEDYIVKAKYVPYNPPKKIPRVDIIGTASEGRLLGQVQFSLNGIACALEAEESGEDLLFHFTDETSKATTYGGGRNFVIPQPTGAEVILDFNLAENWPCAYTPYATCPMVLKENRLPIAIEAGEKKYFEDY